MFDTMVIEWDPAAMGDTELADRLQELCAEMDRLEARRLAVIGEWEHRGVWALDGAANGPAGWPPKAAWAGPRPPA